MPGLRMKKGRKAFHKGALVIFRIKRKGRAVALFAIEEWSSPCVKYKRPRFIPALHDPGEIALTGIVKMKKINRLLSSLSTKRFCISYPDGGGLFFDAFVVGVEPAGELFKLTLKVCGPVKMVGFP